MKKKAVFVVCCALVISLLCCNVSALYIPVYGHYMATKEYEATGEVYASVIRRGQTNIMDYDISVCSDIYSSVDMYYSCTVSIFVESADSSVSYNRIIDIGYDYAGDDQYFTFNPECYTHIHIFATITYNEIEYCYCTYDYYWEYDSTAGRMCFTRMIYSVDEYEG